MILNFNYYINNITSTCNVYGGGEESMEGNEIKVDTKLLDKDKQSLVVEVNKIKKEMKSMHDSIKELDTMWEGTAKNEFVKQFTKDYEFLTFLCNAAEEFVDSLSNASKEYTNCENTTQGIVTSIQI